MEEALKARVKDWTGSEVNSALDALLRFDSLTGKFSVESSYLESLSDWAFYSYASRENFVGKDLLCSHGLSLEDNIYSKEFREKLASKVFESHKLLDEQTLGVEFIDDEVCKAQRNNSSCLVRKSEDYAVLYYMCRGELEVLEFRRCPEDKEYSIYLVALDKQDNDWYIPYNECIEVS